MKTAPACPFSDGTPQRRMYTPSMLDADVANLVKAIEGKDHSTAAHTWRVVLYTKALAEEAAVPQAMIERLTHAAALHDLGKIDIPDSILQKPGKLTDPEFAVIQTHAALGHARLVNAGVDDELILGLVRHHHERIDGTGYPDKLAGDKIPVAARYFSVIDSFDAMTSIRPYRSEVGVRAAEHALADLHEHVGAWYCNESIELLEKLFRKGELDWILEYYNDACPVPAFGEASALKRR